MLKRKRVKKEKIKKEKVKKTPYQKFKLFLLNIIISIFLLIFISVSYFLVLISTEAKSFPFITDAIEVRINKSLGDKGSIKINNSYIEFKRFHYLNITIDDVALKIGAKDEIILPKIEAQFSIFKLLLLKLFPSKISIVGPVIEIENIDNISRISVKETDSDNDEHSYNILNQKEYFKNLWSIILPFKDLVGKFELKDTRIILKNKSGAHNILIKNSVIQLLSAGNYLNLSLNNVISLNPKNPNLQVNIDCKFKDSEGLECNTALFDFIPKSVSKFDFRLAELEKINTRLNGNVNIKITSDFQLSSLLFSLNAANGNFYYPQFFSKTINFTNLSVSGELNNITKSITLTDLKANLDNSAFSMSLKINNFLDQNSQTSEMKFKISDVLTDDLDKMWPIFLAQNGVRSWVISHIKKGIIKDAYAEIKLKSIKGINVIDDVKSEIIFSGLNVKYSEYFPEISEIDGIASFSKNDMKIDLISGDVLDSKIRSATVSIPNFYAKKIMLTIDGSVNGKAFDSLKHINYRDDFANKISDYFNGDASSLISIKFFIENLDSLKDLYIKISSDIRNFNTEYLTGDSSVIVNTVKEFNNNNFVTDIDLSGSKVNLPSYGIVKDKGISSKIKTVLFVDDNGEYIRLTNFNWIQKNAKISGGLTLEISPLRILSLDLKNNNFGQNDFSLSYKIDKNNLNRNFKIIGKNIDLSSLIQSSVKKGGDDSEYKNNNIQIILSNVNLVNNQAIKNLNISINCKEAQCNNSFIKGNMSGKAIDIMLNQKAKDEEYSIIDGRIEDISLLARGLNISNKMISGNSKINGKVELIDNKKVINGELKIDSDFSILKNEVVEKISNQGDFAKFKNKIIEEDKTNLSHLKLEFELKENNFYIKTLITGNYFIGFTSKGVINLSDESIKLRGLIVPGYSLNTLFGLGNLPVIGQIISPIIGEEGGGIFAVRYEYSKNKDQKEGDFKINPASAIAPGAIRNIFDLF